MVLNDYDVVVLSALNKIENGDEIKTKDLTSWAITKKIVPKGLNLETKNQNSLFSLRKMQKMGLIKLTSEESGHKQYNFWEINHQNVCFKRLRFPDGRRDIVQCKINGKWFIRQI